MRLTIDGGWRACALVAVIGACVSACGDSAGDYGYGEDGYGSAANDDAGGGSATAGVQPPAGETGEIPGDDTGGDTTDTEATSTGAATCDSETPVTLYLSPDDSNSMSSPVQARAALTSEWASLDYVALRTWEFLNYYRFDYPPAEPGTVAVHSALAVPDDETTGEWLLQIGVSSELIDVDHRPPMNLTFVLDTSGSMEGEPLELLQASCRAVAHSLREGDVISMVTWNTENNVVLSSHPVAGPDDPALLAAIAQVYADGGTDLHSGLVTGYALAAHSHREGVVSRVLLISDGGANVGVTDVDVIAQYAGGHDQDGIYMVGVGVGTPESYNDTLMDGVTDIGKGASVFIPDEAEAHRMFEERFVSTMMVAARDVQVRLDLPPGFEIARFSGEEYGTNPADIEPQHLAPDDTMVFHQRIRTCAPELVADDTPIGIEVRYKDALTFEQHEVMLDTTFGELLAEDPKLLLEGAAVFEYATALKAMRDQDESALALDRANKALQRAQALAPTDPDLLEIAEALMALQ
jgi:Ca-activated chloride channel family protein